MSTELSIPGTSNVLREGSVVILERYPGTKWVVHNGWYTYNGRAFLGWYFCSIPAKTCIPVTDRDVRTITVVSEGSGDIEPSCPPVPPYPPGPYPPFPPGPPPYPPYPPKPAPQPAFISLQEKARYEAAFISLPHLKDLEALDKDFVPDGKIVRVNNVEGKPKYFIWDKYSYVWSEVPIVSDEDIERLQELIDGVAGDVSELESATEQISGNVAQLTQDLALYQSTTDAAISELQSSTSELVSNVDSLTGEVHELDTAVDQFQTKILDLESDVQSVTANVDELTAKVDEIDTTIGRWTVI